jgi:hypothetical protein
MLIHTNMSFFLICSNYLYFYIIVVYFPSGLEKMN